MLIMILITSIMISVNITSTTE